MITSHITYRISLIIYLFVLFGCTEAEQQDTKDSYITLIGNAQGTTFTITFLDSSDADHSEAVQNILQEIDNSVSTYVEGSVISRFNATDTLTVADEHFFYNIALSRLVYHYSDGAFDPTVMPLVRAWGFGPEGQPEADTTLVDSLLPLIGLGNIENRPGMQEIRGFKDNPITVWKTKSGVQLDFNAIAQGYTVDVIWKYLKSQNINDIMVEVGGEVRASGKNAEGNPWRIGIDKPVQQGSERELQAVVPLIDKALATSGNYRKFYEANGQRYAHTIDPKTGRPVQHGLLSASVLARDCATADAYATAFMVMGLEKTKALLADKPALGLEVYLIYSEDGETKVYSSERFPPATVE